MSSLKSSSSESGAGTLRRLAVASDETGIRLDKWLSGKPGVPSREMARHLITAGAVWLNRGPAEPATRVRAEDVVEFAVPPPRRLELVPERAPLEVLYEDKALVVLVKPAGVPVHPGPGHARGTLVHFLLAHCENLSGIGGALRPGIVHRLDKDTSGVLVTAKNDVAHQALSAQFKAHAIERAYLALVVGRMPEVRGTIDRPLGRDPRHRFRQTVRDDGRRAVTHWRVERPLGPFTLLRLELETGRTHQIRAHLAHSDRPVLGDPLYGRGRHRGLDLPPAVQEELQGFRRQALHAAELGFRHPLSGEWMRFRAPPPADMTALIALLAPLADSSAPAGAGGWRAQR